MPSLHETYATLLRRGMPACERLRLLAHPCHVESDGKPVLMWMVYGANSAFLHEADARDLLTMHALRWWLGTPNAMTVSVRSEHWGSVYPPCATTGLDGSVGHAPTILDAIVAATAHLKPKETP